MKCYWKFNIQTGWGGRDRTFVSRDQNPLPYHLATPHSEDFILTCQANNARVKAVID